jgi:hypothetical protein
VEVPATGGPCRVLDARELRRTGAIAVHARTDGYEIVTAKSVQGMRPWTGHGLLPTASRSWGRQ